MRTVSNSHPFTEDDSLYPVYCTQCRTHIPKAVSNAGKGLCPTCATAAAVAATPTPPQPVDTGMGRCMQCQSGHIVQFEDTAPANSWPYTITALVMGLGSLILPRPLFILFGVLALGIFVAGILQPNKKLGTSRECKACGCRWKV